MEATSDLMMQGPVTMQMFLSPILLLPSLGITFSKKN